MPDPADQTVVEPPVVETPVVEAPKVVAAEPVAEPKPAVAAEPKPAAAAPVKDWKDDRIAELTAKLHRARAAQAEPPKAPDETQAAFDARVEQRARVLADERTVEQTWNNRCNEVANKGKAQFEDFDVRLAGIKSAVDVSDPNEVQAYNTLLAAAMETDRAAELLHELGGDVGEARRLMKLPPMKLAVELAQMASKISAVPEPSSAPKPITPLGSRGVHYDGIAPDDPSRGMKLPKAAWFEQREKQARERGLQ